MVETISAVVPYRNRPLEPFKVCLHSMQHQSYPFKEIIMVDIASHPEYQYPMEQYCREHGVDYHYIDLPVSDTIIEVYLWSLCHNYGFRLATGDLITTTGCDRISERNLVKEMMRVYNFNLESAGKETVMSTRIRNLWRTPKISELADFNKLTLETKWRGGYGFMCVPRLWFDKVHGIDEKLRWYEDQDVAVRAKADGLYFRHISNGDMHGPPEDGEYRMLHISKHKKKNSRRYAGANVTLMARRGKFPKTYYVERHPTIRNDEDWGRITKEKIEEAIRLSKEL